MPLLLTWINFNPGMNKKSRTEQNMGWTYLCIPMLQGKLKFMDKIR